MPEGWSNFFYLTGSAGAGLIGLLFVVMTLTAGGDRARVLRGAKLYMTPTALAFAIVLSVSAVVLAPRLSVAAVTALTGTAALVGLGHASRACIGIRASRRRDEPPHWTDFWWYGAAPTAIYLGLGGASLALLARVDWAVYAIAGSLLALLLVGLRNAWDLVTWMAPLRNAGGG